VSGERHDRGAFLVSAALGRGSLRFRLARLIGSLEHGDLFDWLVGGAGLVSADAPARLRNALSSYFAAAMLMPYAPFREAADDTRLDIDRLGTRFDASFEQVCHRLVTLRRPGAEGVPLHFMRSDIAGNVSKRFSASGLRLPRYGGTCPRWIIHDAFAWPGRIVTQVGQLSDGDTYFFVARTTGWDGSAGAATVRHAVMIGASIAHAGRFAYADGIDLAAPRVVVPIGITCRQCPRTDCTHRAFDRAPVPVPDASVT
jgi:predicted transcriptional regulator